MTRQSVIIAKLSSYPRKNRTKKALWELDNLRALKRGESYHKLVRAVAYANGGKLRVRTDQEQQLWSECSRLLANCIIYYNACILSELLERAERRQDYQRADAAACSHQRAFADDIVLELGLLQFSAKL